MENNYFKAYKEVTEILDLISKEDKEKIPEKIIQSLYDKMDVNYISKIDLTKTFEEQEILKETKAILAVFYRDYWAKPEEKAKILGKQANELIKIEQEKKMKYNSEELFKKEKEPINIQLVSYKKESWYTKFLEFMKRIFNR